MMVILCEGLKKMPRRNPLPLVLTGRDNAIMSALQQPIAASLFVVQMTVATLWIEC